MENLRYPIGHFQLPDSISLLDLATAIEEIRRFPSHLESLLEGIEGMDWEKIYRPGGWKVVELVHHCADSHMNCFIRFKLALSEDDPVVKPYKEDAWALQEDYSVEEVQASLQIIRGIHARWSHLMARMTELEWTRGFFHPEQKRLVPLKEAALFYAWHGNHHLAHIKMALKK